jgi:hypothetical protein
MNDEAVGEDAQSQVHARCMGGMSQVKARGTGGRLTASNGSTVAGLGTFSALALCYRRPYAVCRCPSSGAFAITSTAGRSLGA